MKLSTLFALVVLVALFIWSQQVMQRPDPLQPGAFGKVEAVDGDSLKVSGRMIRLQGIDAPEFNQTCQRDGQETRCGREAFRALKALVSKGEVTCKGFEHDRFDRLLATCSVTGQDIGAAMVRSGHAVSYGDYVLEEAEARANNRGLWAGTFDFPRDWRAMHPSRTESPTPQAPAPSTVPTPPRRP